MSVAVTITMTVPSSGAAYKIKLQRERLWWVAWLAANPGILAQARTRKGVIRRLRHAIEYSSHQEVAVQL